MRRWLLLPLAAASALLVGCRAAAPPDAGERVTWRHPELPGLSFERPLNWTVKLVTQDQATLVVLRASDEERLVITHRRDGAALPVEEFARRVEAEVAEHLPDTATQAAADQRLAGRRAIVVEVTAPDPPRVGRRYVVPGGWIVEWMAREEYQAAVAPAFEAVLASLRFEESGR